MTIDQIRKKILTDNQFIESELKQFAVYYNLKHTIRYNLDRKAIDATESVAEHVYGLHILCDYFLPFYSEVDPLLARKMLTWHDMAEAVVGDMTTKSKTDNHRQAELDAENKIVTNATEHIQGELAKVFSEFNEQKTPTAKFAKGLDKIEPMFYWYFLRHTTEINRANYVTEDSGWNKDEYRDHRNQYIEPFDVLWRFDEILTEHAYQAGFFKDSPC